MKRRIFYKTLGPRVLSNLPKKEKNQMPKTIESFTEEVPTEFKEDVQKAIDILKDAGCKEAYIFGSLAKSEATKKSDIDLAIRDYPIKKFFHIYGKLYMELVHSVDLVDLDMDAYFGDYLEKEGGLVRVL